MEKRIVIIGTIFLILTINCLISCCHVQADNKVVAVVNGQELSRDTLADLLIKTYGREGLEQLSRRTLVKQEAERNNVKVAEEEIKIRIDDLVEGEVKRQIIKSGLKDEKEFTKELEKAGATMEQYRGEIIHAFRLTKEQVEAELMAEKIIMKTVKLTDDELLEAYEEQYGEKIIASQIVLSSMREAEKIVEQINAGVDFEALAKKESNDRSSASRGGQMRPFAAHGILGDAVKK